MVPVAVEQFLDKIKAPTEQELVAFFKEHKKLKAALHVMKGFVQIGFGIVSAYLTGGLMHGGPIEGAISGVLTERSR